VEYGTVFSNVTIGEALTSFKAEFIVRRYLTGSLWKKYNEEGLRKTPWGFVLPDGLAEYHRFDELLFTPTTKADKGHDEDISEEQLIAQGIISRDELRTIKQYCFKLFERGEELVAPKGLVLVDTKFEFGRSGNGEIVLIDEALTPDSSRYWLTSNKPFSSTNPPQGDLSKEFLRKWLKTNGFEGKKGQKIPNIPANVIHALSEIYVDLCETITGVPFDKSDTKDWVETTKKWLYNESILREHRV
jgi:phosphoribosylaminoimidazole-succinocarboxamide synthase